MIMKTNDIDYTRYSLTIEEIAELRAYSPYWKHVPTIWDHVNGTSLIMALIMAVLTVILIGGIA